MSTVTIIIVGWCTLTPLSKCNYNYISGMCTYKLFSATATIIIVFVKYMKP